MFQPPSTLGSDLSIENEQRASTENFSSLRTSVSGAKSEEGRLYSQARLFSFFVALIKLEIIISTG